MQNDIQDVLEVRNKLLEISPDVKLDMVSDTPRYTIKIPRERVRDVVDLLEEKFGILCAGYDDESIDGGYIPYITLNGVGWGARIYITHEYNNVIEHSDDIDKIVNDINNNILDLDASLLPRIVFLWYKLARTFPYTVPVLFKNNDIYHLSISLKYKSDVELAKDIFRDVYGDIEWSIDVYSKNECEKATVSNTENLELIYIFETNEEE